MRFKIEGCGCLGMIASAIFQLGIGGLSVDYILSWFAKDIPFIGDMIIGLFLAEISIPVAIVGWVCKFFGVF